MNVDNIVNQIMVADDLDALKSRNAHLTKLVKDAINLVENSHEIGDYFEADYWQWLKDAKRLTGGTL